MPDGREARLKKIAGDAARVVAELPAELRATAFGKVFDILLADESDGPPRAVVPQQRRAERREVLAGPKDGVRVDSVMAALDRTDHPNIEKAGTALDAALLVLKASRDHAGEEWLIPSEISRVLKDKFRHPVEEGAIRMALGGARTLVDRRKARRGFEYRIMGPGEARLAAGTGDAGSSGPGNNKKKGR